MRNPNIDHTSIIELLKEAKYSHGEIAKVCHCSLKTVNRIALKHGLQYGKGVRYVWRFTESSTDLAYLIGMFLTDGTINKKGYRVNSTSDEIAERVTTTGSAIGLIPRCYIQVDRSDSIGDKPLHYIELNSVYFGRWMLSVCGKKERIPEFLYAAPIEHKVAFLSAVIDGDGHVDIEGTIRIMKTLDWLFELPSFCQSMGIRSSISEDRILESGKIVRRVTVRRSDFVKLNPVCVVPYKLERMLNGKVNRHR